MKNQFFRPPLGGARAQFCWIRESGADGGAGAAERRSGAADVDALTRSPWTRRTVSVLRDRRTWRRTVGPPGRVSRPGWSACVSLPSTWSSDKPLRFVSLAWPASAAKLR